MTCARRQSLWIIGHVSTLRRCPPWAALIEHVANQGCLFTACGPFEQLLSANREELIADTALLLSLRHTKEKRHDRGSSEDPDNRQARQKRVCLEQPTAAATATSPLAGIEPRSGTHALSSTAKRKHSAVDNSKSGILRTEAASASTGAQDAAEHPQEPGRAAGQVHLRLQAAPSDGDLYLQRQQTQPAQHEPTRAGRQNASGSKASDTSKHPGNGPSNKGVGHARSSNGRAPAGAVTAIINPLLNRTSLLPQAGGKDSGKSATMKQNTRKPTG